MGTRMKLTIRLCSSLFLVGLLVIVGTAVASPNPRIEVAGAAWYDDDGDALLDPEEQLAPGVMISVFVGTYGSHGRQPQLVSEVISDNDGHFNVAFELAPNDPAFLSVAWALRPGYPYSPVAMVVPAPSGYVGYNYTSTFVPIPFDSSERVTVNLPLAPLPGVLDRVPAGTPPDFAIPGGHFFTQTNGLVGDSRWGFAVTNDDGIPFWETWQHLGGLENVGYPLSQRLVWRGFLVQVFQKAVFQWQPGKGVFLINIFDELNDLELDRWLHDAKATPVQLSDAFDGERSWVEIVRDRLLLLNANRAIDARYHGLPDPLLLCGLPTSLAEDFGDVVAIRTQRTVLQQWEVDLPWAKPGQVTLANGGQIAKEVGLFGNVDAFIPIAPPASGS